MDSGQISHRRALVEGCCRHCRCPQTSGKSRRFVDLCNIGLKKNCDKKYLNQQKVGGACPLPHWVTAFV
ncbi:hypothetical protein PFWH6_0936 [Pseudomonas fluorescens WH6]|nr:hypothetical protein PFWH6_0936 [Pseudomonas fluorescens WH6]